MSRGRAVALWCASLMFVVMHGDGFHSAASAQQIPDFQVGIVEHPIDVRPDDVLRFVVRAQGDIPDDAVVVVRVFDPVVDRVRLREALNNDPGPTRDRVTLAWADLAVLRNGETELLVPTTSGDLERGVLRLASAGVHPLRIEIRTAPVRGRDSPILAQTATVVHAVTAASTAALDITYVAMITAPPARQPDGTIQISSRTRQTLEDLASIVETTDQVFSVGLAPETIDALSTGDPQDRTLWNRLAVGLTRPAGREIIAAPAVTLSPATAVRSGLSDTYTALLRRGEDTLANLVGRANVQRSVHMVNDPLDIESALLIRDLGTRSLVLTPDTQRRINIDRNTLDPTLMVVLPIGAQSDIPAAVVDGVLARRLALPLADSVNDTVAFVAELLVMRYGVVAALGDNTDPVQAAATLDRRSITLTTPDGTLADPSRLMALFEAIDRTQGLRMVTASQAGGSTDLAMNNGARVQLELPTAVGFDLRERAEAMLGVSLDAFTVASMLAQDDLRPLAWGDQLWRLAAQDYDDQSVEEGFAQVRAQMDDVRRAVSVPSANDVTLGGRRSTIRLKLHNDASFEVRVAVRLESAKLSFPNGQELVTLPASTVTEVEIPVEVRSNGRFPVSVTLLTPEGDVPLGNPVEFAARSTALTGLGQVVTAAGVLILASWWFRHGRARRRAKQ